MFWSIQLKQYPIDRISFDEKSTGKWPGHWANHSRLYEVAFSQGRKFSFEAILKEFAYFFQLCMIFVLLFGGILYIILFGVSDEANQL